jgi:hypothetical protein
MKKEEHTQKFSKSEENHEHDIFKASYNKYGIKKPHLFEE